MFVFFVHAAVFTLTGCVHVSVCVCVCVRACVRVCMRACMHACMRVSQAGDVHTGGYVCRRVVCCVHAGVLCLLHRGWR